MNYKNIFKWIVCGMLVVAATSCKKDELTKVDMSQLNPDDPLNTNTPLDQWLKANFLDRFNSAVVYRYNRYYHEADRNLSPIDVQYVQPTMQAVLSGFANIYSSVAGETFMKVNMPKEWVLYGSTSYDASNIGYAGTAAGGVRVNLFGLNSYANNSGFWSGRLGVIHHEFTHILNQRFAMPADFQTITKSSYNGNWNATPVDSAHKWGFVGNYASQNPTEDFADMVKTLLVSGQTYFDWWVATTGSTVGSTALRAKEASVASYYSSGLGFDFRELQKRVQLYLKDSLKDVTTTMPYWFARTTAGTTTGYLKTITVDPANALYITYPNSASFNSAYNSFKIYMAGLNPSRVLNSMQIRFNTPTSVTVRMNYTSGTTAGAADYDFTAAINTTTGVTTFTRTAQSSTTGNYANAAIFATGFASTIEAYLTSGSFVGDWLPLQAPAANFTKTGGFTKVGDTGNYFYGTLGAVLN